MSFISKTNHRLSLSIRIFYLQELGAMSAHLVTSFDIFLIQAITCFIYCYFGNRITSKSLQIGETAYAIEWYLLPPHIQKVIQLIILRSQCEIYFTGFSVIVCSLEMYKKVKLFFPKLLMVGSM